MPANIQRQNIGSKTDNGILSKLVLGKSVVLDSIIIFCRPSQRITILLNDLERTHLVWLLKENLI